MFWFSFLFWPYLNFFDLHTLIRSCLFYQKASSSLSTSFYVKLLMKLKFDMHVPSDDDIFCSNLDFYTKTMNFFFFK